MTLTAEKLSFRRGDRLLFSDLDLSLHPGQALELRGANGSGKTSLLRLLCGLVQPEQGSVLWRGHPIDEDPAAFRAEMAYIGHAQGLNANLSPVENLAFLQALSVDGAIGLSPREALARLGLYGGLIRMPCRQLSAGQKKRVSLARLLLTRATLWLLDEPLVALDAGSSMQVQAMMVDHLAGDGMIVAAMHGSIDFGAAQVSSLAMGG